MKKNSRTIEIFLDNLAVIKNGGHERLPLSALDSESHIHGRLTIRIQERPVPSLGFWGPDDVCIGDWIEALKNALKQMEAKAEPAYLFDEGEQGQPAYLFERQGETVRFSIIKSGISGAEGDAAWQSVALSLEDLQEQYEALRIKLLSEIEKAAPEMQKAWAARF